MTFCARLVILVGMTRKLTDQEAAERKERRRKYAREYMREYAKRPGVREILAERTRKRRELHREKTLASSKKAYYKFRDKRLAEQRRRYHRYNEYRDIAERMIGRPLAKREHVHHIDCDHSNNVESNLHVMSASQHLRAHTSLNALARGLIADGIIRYDRETMAYCRVTNLTVA